VPDQKRGHKFLGGPGGFQACNTPIIQGKKQTHALLGRCGGTKGQPQKQDKKNGNGGVARAGKKTAKGANWKQNTKGEPAVTSRGGLLQR